MLPDTGISEVVGLGFSLTGSIIVGLVSAIALMFIAPVLAQLAAKFGPREYLAISVFGLVVVVRVVGKSLPKGLLMGALGLFLTTWGLDELNGTERYTFGSYHLYEGLPLVPFLVGLFAMSEVLIGAERAAKKVSFDASSLTVKLPGLRTLGRMKDVIMRSSIIGTVIGIIPGEGAAVGAFFAYSEAKRRSKTPEAYLVTRHLIKDMRKGGKIINLTSGKGYSAGANSSAYHVSKTA